MFNLIGDKTMDYPATKRDVEKLTVIVNKQSIAIQHLFKAVSMLVAELKKGSAK